MCPVYRGQGANFHSLLHHCYRSVVSKRLVFIKRRNELENLDDCRTQVVTIYIGNILRKALLNRRR